MNPRTVQRISGWIWEIIYFLIFIGITLSYTCNRIGLHSNDPYRDGASFIHANHMVTLYWWQQFQHISMIQAQNPHISFLDGLLDFVFENHADYMVLYEEFDPQKHYPQGINDIYPNLGYSLYQLTN
jgi:hypothetical protein